MFPDAVRQFSEQPIASTNALNLKTRPRCNGSDFGRARGRVRVRGRDDDSRTTATLETLTALADPTRREIARPAPVGERQVPVGHGVYGVSSLVPFT